MNGNRSYDPRAKSLPGTTERKRPDLKLVASNDKESLNGPGDA